MILNHDKQLIFIKTSKTAGTSIEVALARHCRKGDVVTPFGTGESQEMRKTNGAMTPTGYLTPFPEYGAIDWLRLIARRKRAVRFHPHTPASEAKQYLGHLWNQYTTFSVIRNPWDRIVSAYHWHRHRYTTDITFSEYIDWVLLTRPWILTNWTYIGERNDLLVNRILRYENLTDELSQLSREIGIDISLPQERFKGGARDSGHYRDILTDTEADLIARICHREIDAFGYTF